MGTRTGPVHVLEWQSNLAGMRKHGTRVQWSCETCRGWGAVDLEPLIARLGEAGSLWDRQPPCKVPGCGGRVFFLASPGSGTPFRPLLSQAGRVTIRP